MKSHAEDSLEDPINIRMRYVAFCDVLGFSNAVQERFEETITVYADFMKHMRGWQMPKKTEISIYSDSILIVADDLTLRKIAPLDLDSTHHKYRPAPCAPPKIVTNKR